MKRKIYFLVSLNEAKRKRDGFCFALFHFEAKKNNKRKWDTLIRRCPPTSRRTPRHFVSNNSSSGNKVTNLC